MSESKEEIMEATYQALCSHGYVDLTIEKIAEESEKGKSNIYYHFDDKETLILNFLDFMKDNLEEEFESLNSESPEKSFDDLLDKMLGVKDEKMRDFHRALMEIQGRAHYNEDFQQKFRELDKIVVREFTEILDDLGVEEAQEYAQFTVSTVQGSINQGIIHGDMEKLENVKEKLQELF